MAWTSQNIYNCWEWSLFRLEKSLPEERIATPMEQLPVGVLIFFCLAGAALGSLLIYPKMARQHWQDDTHNVVRLAAGIFALMTSLVLGLLLNSAKNTFESIDRNVHSFATELILMDRTLRQYGPETADARQRLDAYVIGH
jgi:hypothetical protein